MQLISKNIYFSIPTSNVLQFPNERKEHGAMPNVLLRSNLFGVVKKGKSNFVEERLLDSQGSDEIIYSGKELNQSDMDVWLILKKEFIGKKESEKVTFMSKDILKKLGKSYGQSDKKWLKKKVLELASGVLVFNKNQMNMGDTVRLIYSVRWIDDFNTFELDMDKRICNFFKNTTFTYLSLEIRKKLHGDLSKWLYSYWCTHKDLYPIKDTTILTKCGSTCTNNKEWRKYLKKALDQLVSVGFLKEYHIDLKGVLSVQRIN